MESKMSVMLTLALIVVLEFRGSHMTMVSQKQLKMGAAEKACSHYKELRKGMIARQANSQILSDPDTSDYRVLGEKVKGFEYPHMAAIGWEGKKAYQYLCGGTLISERYVLTAAHCKSASYPKSRDLARPEPTVVKLGVTDLYKPSAIIAIEEIIPHDKYSAPIMYYDIALLRLKITVRFATEVMPACLWDEERVAERGVATGWGYTKSGRTVAAEASHELHGAAVDVVPARRCDDALAYHNWPLGTAEHQLCAGDASGAGADTCQGDSGSPLQVRRGGMSYVIGVTSFGHRRCGRYPAIYTRVAHFVPWIEAHVWPERARADT